jgi:hypothetical protein
VDPLRSVRGSDCVRTVSQLESAGPHSDRRQGNHARKREDWAHFTNLGNSLAVLFNPTPRRTGNIPCPYSPRLGDLGSSLRRYPSGAADESLASSIGRSCVGFRPALVDSGVSRLHPRTRCGRFCGLARNLHGLTATDDLEASSRKGVQVRILPPAPRIPTTRGGWEQKDRKR